jgi:hypothetical protein
MKKYVFLALAICVCALLLSPAPTPVHGQGGIDTSKWYKIIAKHSSKCLDMRFANLVDGEHLIQYDCNGGDNQKFQFQTVSGGYYRIVIGHSRKCIDQIGANQTNGGIFGQYGCHSGTNQQFLPSYSGGYYQFNVHHSGKNMDVLGGSYSNAAQLVQYIAYGTDNQLFSIEEVSAPCADADSDGFCTTFDCDDTDPDIYPGAPIFCETGVDRNCNSLDDYEECNPY